jgi:uncharacterized coiled-coil protein SlyX
MKNHQNLILILVLTACIGLSPETQAVVPAPDGGYAGGNTAEGQSALFSLTTGGYNTAVGLFSLKSNATGNFNTGVGAGALLLNTADSITATGAGALLSNTTGGANTANGAFALVSNTTGNNNNAFGYQALFSNTTGPFNNAFGNGALAGNTTGDRNTAMGEGALLASTNGSQNTAVGVSALRNNTTGSDNIAIGQDACNNNGTASFNTGVGWKALTNNVADANTAIGASALFSNSTGTRNTAVGGEALAANTAGSNNTALGANTLATNTTGPNNTAIGSAAGANITGSGNVCIGAGVAGAAGEDNTVKIANNLPITTDGSACYIGGIYNQFVDQLTAAPVVIDASGKLGTFTSSQRFKHDVKPMANSSESILKLKPVSFHYKKDAKQTLCFGLIAEEVAAVNPDLVVRDKNGEIYTVRYEAVNAMLLNEFLREHRKVGEQQVIIAELKSAVAQQRKEFGAVAAKEQEQIQALVVGLQKVSARVAAASPHHRTEGAPEKSETVKGRLQHGRHATQVVLNNP